MPLCSAVGHVLIRALAGTGAKGTLTQRPVLSNFQ
jgi:hypothetical protein